MSPAQAVSGTRGDLTLADEEHLGGHQVVHSSLSLPFLHCLCQRRLPASMPGRQPAGHLHKSLRVMDSGQRHAASHCQGTWAALSGRPQGDGAVTLVKQPQASLQLTESLRRVRMPWRTPWRRQPGCAAAPAPPAGALEHSPQTALHRTVRGQPWCAQGCLQLMHLAGSHKLPGWSMVLICLEALTPSKLQGANRTCQAAG